MHVMAERGTDTADAVVKMMISEWVAAVGKDGRREYVRLGNCTALLCGPGQSAPKQKEQNDDHHYQAEATTIVMVWRTKIEATPTEKENQPPPVWGCM